MACFDVTAAFRCCQVTIIREITDLATCGSIPVPSAFDSSSSSLSLPSLLVVDTELQVLGEHAPSVLTGFLITTGKEADVAVFAAVSWVSFEADDLLQQEPIVF